KIWKTEASSLLGQSQLSYKNSQSKGWIHTKEDHQHIWTLVTQYSETRHTLLKATVLCFTASSLTRDLRNPVSLIQPLLFSITTYNANSSRSV
ncbi:hypothetical protein WG66_014617, partial [Moniliophthora roreri]